ncbi:hypothetical protein BDZ91DRAFT_315352 [Kalaharituber pfeilii]|nr:hypothetical protein BDZ91DRAFT_315352 [Kalaharituber pfeilii]
MPKSKVTMGNILVFPLIDRLLQKIGFFKPNPKPLGPKDELWLFNNTAFRSPKNPNEWMTEFVASYFQFDTGDAASRNIADIIEKLGIVRGDAAERLVAERVELFLNIIQPGRTAELQIERGAGGKFFLGPAGSNGISSNALPFPSGSYHNGQFVSSTAVLPQGYGRGQLNGFETMTTVFAEPEGWGVVSDIDDTIKITHVLSHIDILKHTFALPAQAVPGMPEFFQNVLAPTLNNPVWFYVTASPYNLYPFLSRFIDDFGFPKGTIILRDLSWQEIEAFIYTSLTIGTEQYKIDRISKIHSWFPRRKMVLIGDSTQKDPEVYGEVARRWPGWVKTIYIRVVKGVDVNKEKDLNSVTRFERAFRGLDRALWSTFEDVSEIGSRLTAVVQADLAASQKA